MKKKLLAALLAAAMFIGLASATFAESTGSNTGEVTKVTPVGVMQSVKINGTVVESILPGSTVEVEVVFDVSGSAYTGKISAYDFEFDASTNNDDVEVDTVRNFSAGDNKIGARIRLDVGVAMMATSDQRIRLTVKMTPDDTLAKRYFHETTFTEYLAVNFDERPGSSEPTPPSATTITFLEVAVDYAEATPGTVVTIDATAIKDDGTIADNAQFIYSATKGTWNDNKLIIPVDAKDKDVITIIVMEETTRISEKVTVTVKAATSNVETPKPDQSTSSGGFSSSGNSSLDGPAPTEETVSASQAAQKTEQAIAAAEKADPDASQVVVKVRNVKSITAAALKAVARTAEKAEKASIVHADVVKDGKVESRLYIDPSLVKGNEDIRLGVTLGDEKVSEKFDKYFKNNIAVVKFDQAGSFGMAVKAAVKLDLAGMDTKALIFYSYDPKTNTYSRIAAPNYRVDRNGYLHFTTSVGNCVIVTDEPLVRK